MAQPCRPVTVSPLPEPEQASRRRIIPHLGSEIRVTNCQRCRRASNTDGISNTANGFNALSSNTSGKYNTANGYQALYSNVGFHNTASGNQTLYNNSTGDSNMAIGAVALSINATGHDNTGCRYLCRHQHHRRRQMSVVAQVLKALRTRATPPVSAKFTFLLPAAGKFTSIQTIRSGRLPLRVGTRRRFSRWIMRARNYSSSSR